MMMALRTMTILCLILSHWLFTILAFPLIRLRKRRTGDWCVVFSERGAPTWKRFFELPGRLRSLFSPTFLVPSLMLDELEVKGSGAATFESFCGMVNGAAVAGRRATCRFAFLADHVGAEARHVG